MLVMLYARRSFVTLVLLPVVDRLRALRGRKRRSTAAWYDQNLAGEHPPHTDFLTTAQVAQYLTGMANVEIHRENLDGIVFPTQYQAIARHGMLAPVVRRCGRDLYVRAVTWAGSRKAVRPMATKRSP